MRRKNEKRMELLVYVLIAGLIAISLFFGYQWYQKYYGENYKTAIASELDDKCSTPTGYTDETWREHMDHHPDRYGECLGG